MDSGACADLCKDRDKDKGLWANEKPDEIESTIPPTIGTTMETEHVPPTAKADCLVPITPVAVRENGDFPIDLQSPLTVVRKQLKLACIDSERNVTASATTNIAFVDIDNDNGSPRTPKDGVFDPFAPGPDNMARAPQGKKYLDELRITVARRLDFDPSFDAFHDAESLSDQDMFESVYENLLQVIVSKQTEGVLAPMSNVEYDSDDCKTPPSPLQFTGISDTCPGAPVKVKPGGKPRNIQVGLCKKLEF